MPIYDSITDLVGRTPMIRLNRLRPAGAAEVCLKLESLNPGGSVKDRPALAMLLAAEREGTLRPGATIVEATSGNTGISLAMVAAARGYRCVLVMPEDMSQARRYMLRSYGAEVALTPATEGMAGAVQQARQLLQETEGAFMPSQFDNPENPAAHSATTAEEIWEDTGGQLDALVAGVGTGGTLTGVARVLKKRLPNLLVVAVEPKASAILSGGKPGLHGIQGLGAGFIPQVLERQWIDRVVPVTDVAAERGARRLADREGVLAGPSSGANVHAALEIAAELPEEARVVTVVCDGGERYLC